MKGTKTDILNCLKELGSAYSFLYKDDDAKAVWYNSFIDLEIEDLRRVVSDYIREETTAPTIAVIRNRAKLLAKQRQAIMNAPRSEQLYKCGKCKDTGWTFWVSPTGLEMAEPCKCEAGQRTYYAKSEEDRRRIDAEEARKGSRADKPIMAPMSYYMECVYGKEAE